MHSDVKQLLEAYHRINLSGPSGDTKYDIFDRGGPNGEPPIGGRGRRHSKPKPRRRKLPPATTGGATPGEWV